MKLNPKVFVLAVGCFLIGFLTRSWLTPPQQQPAPVFSAPVVASLAVLTPLTVSTQMIHIYDGGWNVDPDVGMPPNSEWDRGDRNQRYDLIDPHYVPRPLDLK